MTRKLFAFLLSELTIVRLICRGKLPNGEPCWMVSEVPVDRLGSCPIRCPVCATEIDLVDGSGSQVNPYRELAKAVALLRQAGKQVELEFVLPEE